MSERKHTVVVKPLPAWFEPARLLATDAFVKRLEEDGETYSATLTLESLEAADLAARLRGLGIDGRAIEVAITPALSRTQVRDARTRDARARRDTTPGFAFKSARATGEGRYSLTPDVLALEIGSLAQGRSVLDACAGSGGNTIGFARAGSQVMAIELDLERMREAEHNARVYGVSERIRFMHGDATALVPRMSADILFIDPPWGQEFDKRHTTLDSFPLLSALIESARQFSECWIKVPMSFATNSLAPYGPINVTPIYGKERGDHTRIKFLLLRLSARSTHGTAVLASSP